MVSHAMFQNTSVVRRLGKKCLFTVFALLILLSPYVIFQAGAASSGPVFGAIRIMPDGTVEGTDKIQRNGNVYTLTDDINVELNNTFGSELKPCLLIMRDNIIVDGAGHTITSNGTGLGIYARGVQGVTIENFKIRGFVEGISSYIMDPVTPIEVLYKKTANNRIINNDIEVVNSQSPYYDMLSGWGIFVEFSEDILVSGNTIKTATAAKGLYVGSTCNRTTITNNRFIGCGLDLYTLKEKTISGNTIDGKPVVFLNGESNRIVEDAEQVLIYNCDAITVRNIKPNNGYRRTVQLEKTSNSVVTDCQGIIALINSTDNSVYGNSPKNIALFFSSNHNKVFGNTISDGYVIFPRATNEYYDARRCIDLSASSYNNIYNNTLKNSNQGIHLGEPEGASQYNNIFQNDIFNVGQGVLISYSPQNYIYSNKIGNCSVGISVSVSNNVIAAQNNITKCGLALSIMGSDNQSYHNNFFENTKQAAISHQMLFSSNIIVAYSVNNTFDIGYPAGGNYWSNFQGVDSNGDGISETPYIIDSNNTDHYPFMQPTNFSDFVPPTPPLSDPPGPSPSPTVSPTNTPAQQSTPTPTTAPTMPEFQTWMVLPLIMMISLIIASAKFRKPRASMLKAQ